MSTEIRQREKVSALLRMLEADSDGAALNAARMLAREAARRNLNVLELVQAVLIDARADTDARQGDHRDRGGQARDRAHQHRPVRDAYLLDNLRGFLERGCDPPLTDWEISFARSVLRWNGALTAKQRAKVEDIITERM